MGEIRWTNEAELWLKDIFDFIVQDNPDAAQKVINGIFEKSQLLTEFPRTGCIYRSEPGTEIRILLYGHYRIAYLLRDDHSIDVLGVFHGALDIERYLP